MKLASKFRSLKWSIPGGIVAVFVAVLGVFVPSSYAALDTGPLSGSSWINITKNASNPAKASYVLSRDDYTNIYKTSIRIYVPADKPSAQIRIVNYNMCVSSAMQLGTTNSFDQDFTNTNSLKGKLVSTYAFSGVNGGSVNTNGWNGRGVWSSDCKANPRTITLQNAPIDPSTGMRVYKLEAAAASLATAGAKFVNLFWLQSLTDGIIFSQIGTSRGADPLAFGYQLSSPIHSSGNNGGSDGKGAYYTTRLPFGSDCTVTSTRSATISFFDLDYPGDRSVQPQAISLRVVDEATKQGLRLSYANGNAGTVSSPSKNNTYTVTKSLNQKYLNLKFTAKPGGRYSLYLSNIYYNNTLQFALPYESVFFYTPCKGQLEGRTTLDKQFIVPGQTANWTHQMQNVSTAGTVGKLNAKINRQITKDGAAGAVQTTDLLTNATLAPRAASPNPARKTSFEAEASDVGSEICEWLTWTSDSGNGTNKSPNYCVTVGKQPKLQIWGGDLRSGGDVNTSYADIRGAGVTKVYGSWGEYGAFMNGYNQANGFASAAATQGGLTRTAAIAQDVKRLAFANTSDNGAPTGGWGGGYSTVGPNGVQLLTGFTDGLGLPARGAVSGTVNLSSQLSGTYTTTSVSLAGAQVGPGKTIVIRGGTNSTVTIRGNIDYAGTNFALDQLPQVIIIADKINIEKDVTTVNAWLIARDRVNTCSNQNPSLDGCKEKLQINGPVATKESSFRRTAGSDDTNRAGDPAEILNLRADAYLWAYGRASREAVPTTIKITTLPPRY